MEISRFMVDEITDACQSIPPNITLSLIFVQLAIHIYRLLVMLCLH